MPAHKKYELGPAARKLNPRQLAFVESYLKNGTEDGAITKAAIAAGYSVTSAAGHGSRLLDNEDVQRAIQELQYQSAERIGITQDRILQELAKIAFASHDHEVSEDADGNEIVTLAGPTEITVTSTGKNKPKIITKKSIKLVDRISALEKLGKNLGMFKDHVEVSAKMSLLELVEASMHVKVKTPQIIDQPELIQIENAEEKSAV